MRVRSAARRTLSYLPVAGLIARPPARPDGISAVVRVRGDEEWLEPAVLSLQDFADEILVLDNGASEGARAAIERLVRVLGSRLVRIHCPRLDLFEVSNLGLVEMTRKNVSAGLLEQFSSKCEECSGRGVIIHDHVVAASTSVDSVE